LDSSEDVLILRDPSLPLAHLGELKEIDEFKTNISLDDQCGMLVESEDTFSDEHSFDEPSDMEFSGISPYIELINPFCFESSPNLAPTPPISPISSPLPLFLPCLDPPKSTFVESETSILGRSCLDQTSDDTDIVFGLDFRPSFEL